MKKIFLSFVVVLIIFVVACQQSAEKSSTGKDAMKKTETAGIAPPADTTGNAAVDAVGNDLNNANADEKDLGAGNLNDLDSGLSDIENI